MEPLITQLQPFLTWLVRCTLQASVLICLILLVQLLLRHKLGPRWSHALWLILLIRMVLPWAPASHLSIFNLMPQVGWGLPHRFPGEWHLPQRLSNGGLKPTLPNSVSTSDTPASAGARSQPIATVPQPGPKESGQFKSAFLRAVTVLPLVWLTGAIVLGIYICVSSFSLLRIVRCERPLTDQKILDLVEDCKAEMGIRTILGIVATDKVRSACLFGFIRPRLLLPKGMVEALSREELRYVFLHELGHLKRHDIWLGWLTSILQALHWFNPLVWLALYRMRFDRELACDAFVLARTQPDEFRNYGQTIVSLLERFSRPQVLPALAGILETKAQLKRRITMIAKSKKSSPVQWAAAVLIFAALVGVGLTDAYPAPPPFEFGEPVNLGPAINGPAFECAARLSQDGLCLFFQRDVSAWMATRATKDDPWGAPVKVWSEGDDRRVLGKTYKVMPGFTTGDGLEWYFSVDNSMAIGYGNQDLWVMKRETIGADFGPPVNLGPVVNSPADEICPTVAPDGLELYFSGFEGSAGHVRPGGYGHSDLWVTRRTTRYDPWGTPENLGPIVNSAYQDARPRLSLDGLLLLFDSGRPSGYGQNDLYMTTRATRSSPWGPAVNLGPLVNSPGFEEMPFVSSDGSTLYWDSDRAGGYGSHDVWQAPILAGPACGDADHPYPAVDLNKDCRVDFADLAVLLAHWLECTAPECE